MSVETTPQCVLGHGDCPQSCENYEHSRKTTEEQGEDFDPYISRLNVFFGDAYNQNITVVDTSRAISRCEGENSGTE